jgi:hypothetical protein
VASGWPAVVAIAVGWSAFASFVVWQAVAGPPLIWNDSLSYRAVAAEPLWSLAFWTGARPPLVPLVIKATGSSAGFVTTQAVVSVVAWSVLAWTVGRLVPPGWRRVAAVWTVLGFATTLPVALWNRSVLSESLSMSLLALLFAALLWTVQRVTWPRLLATVATALGLAATRDAAVWTVGFVCLSVGACAVTRLHRGVRTAVRLAVLASCLVAVVLLTGWGAASSGRTVQSVTDVLYVRVFPFPGRVSWFADHGMPQGPAIDDLARELPPPPEGAAKVVGISPKDPAFVPLHRWITHHGESTYALWLVTHPAYVVTEPLARPERTYNSARGNLDFYAPTTDSVTSPLTEILWPSLAWLGVLALVAGLLAIWRGTWRLPAWRITAVLAVIGGLSMLVAWHGDGQETTRHTVEGFAQLRLGLWLLAILGALGPVEPAATSTGRGPTTLNRSRVEPAASTERLAAVEARPARR